MTRFDHRLDNRIERKEDMRFTELQDAIDFADSQCRVYGDAQNVVPAESPDIFKIIECNTRLPQAVHYVSEVFAA